MRGPQNRAAAKTTTNARPYQASSRVPSPKRTRRQTTPARARAPRNCCAPSPRWLTAATTVGPSGESSS
eukprot:4305050-Lingulodinium_polyedra.AAC.1